MTSLCRTIVLAAAFVLAACTGGRANLDPASVQVPAAERLTDGQIAWIAAAAHTAHVQQGELGAERGASSGVRTFGELMSGEYGSLDTRLTGIVGNAGILPVAHPIGMQALMRSARIAEDLRDVRGEGFDRTYMRRQAELTRWYLALLDHSLLPSAKNPQLRQHLLAVRTATAGHLEAARGLSDPS
ncbi:MAG TPA: DUF4142 domain-containing protein [Longimicrobiaceae bacterium]|nr:DUF4142 domain-containing protein [Longimicrobiaceae bacterium]